MNVDLNDERIKNNKIKVMLVNTTYPCIIKVWNHIDGIDVEKNGTKYYRALMLYHKCNKSRCNDPHCGSQVYRVKLQDFNEFIRYYLDDGFKISAGSNCCKCNCSK